CFQAEDGIRDFHVTGVQTCALPILADRLLRVIEARAAAHESATLVWPDALGRDGVVVDRLVTAGASRRPNGLLLSARNASRAARSEERRVGEEDRRPWRWGWSRHRQ